MCVCVCVCVCLCVYTCFVYRMCVCVLCVCVCCYKYSMCTDVYSILITYNNKHTVLYKCIHSTFGSCFAMSPPTNTASRYTHRFCTVIQLSIMSEELDSFWTHDAMSFLKGALYLKQRGSSR